MCDIEVDVEVLEENAQKSEHFGTFSVSIPCIPYSLVCGILEKAKKANNPLYWSAKQVSIRHRQKGQQIWSSPIVFVAN